MLNDFWLELARPANVMADRLAAGLATPDMPAIWPVEANDVFVRLTTAVEEHLKARGAMYYPGIGAARSYEKSQDPNPRRRIRILRLLKAAIAAAP